MSMRNLLGNEVCYNSVYKLVTVAVDDQMQKLCHLHRCYPDATSTATCAASALVPCTSSLHNTHRKTHSNASHPLICSLSITERMFFKK